MKSRAAADERLIVDAHVTGKQAIVRNDHSISQRTIMAEVRADHEKIPIAEDGRAPLSAAAMDRAVLANHIAIPKFECAFRCRIKGQILRRRSEDRAVADKIPRAHLHRPFNDDVRLDDAFFSDNRSRADDRIGADLHFSAELRGCINNCRWVNLHRTPASLKLK